VLPIMRTHDKHVFRTKFDHEIVHARGAGAVGTTYPINWSSKSEVRSGITSLEKKLRPVRVMSRRGNRNNYHYRNHRGNENVKESESCLR